MPLECMVSKQFMDAVVHLVGKALEQGFQRREQQRQGRAQFMADVGEEPALEAVEFDQLAVGFFELLAVFVQFVAEGEFAES